MFHKSSRGGRVAVQEVVLKMENKMKFREEARSCSGESPGSDSALFY